MIAEFTFSTAQAAQKWETDRKNAHRHLNDLLTGAYGEHPDGFPEALLRIGERARKMAIQELGGIEKTSGAKFAE